MIQEINENLPARQFLVLGSVKSAIAPEVSVETVEGISCPKCKKYHERKVIKEEGCYDRMSTRFECECGLEFKYLETSGVLCCTLKRG